MVPQRRRLAVAARRACSHASTGTPVVVARRRRVPAVDAPPADLRARRCVLFTRDLRVHDHPALAAACAAFDRVVPLYVLDPALADRSRQPAPGSCTSASPTCGTSLRERGGDLVIRTATRWPRRSGWPGEVGAEGDRARRRRQPLRPPPGAAAARRVRAAPAAPAAVPRRDGRRRRARCGPRRRRPLPGLHARTTGPGRRSAWRDGVAAPRRVAPARRASPVGRLPTRPAASRRTRRSAARPRPGSGSPPGCRTLDRLRRQPRRPGRRRHLPAQPVPALRLPVPAGGGEPGRRPAPSPFVRQLCWRDFYYQVTARLPGDLGARPTGAARPSSGATTPTRWRPGRGADRDADRGRRHAAAARRGLDAQPGPADHRRPT